MASCRARIGTGGKALICLHDGERGGGADIADGCGMMRWRLFRACSLSFEDLFKGGCLCVSVDISF
eukprot:761587-Hanusia_phi.AAC.2